MDPYIKLILLKAIKYKKNIKKRDNAIDTIFVKMIVIPIQRAWRSRIYSNL